MALFGVHRDGLAARLFGGRDVRIVGVQMVGDHIILSVDGADVADCGEIVVVTEQNTHIVPKCP